MAAVLKAHCMKTRRSHPYSSPFALSRYTLLSAATACLFTACSTSHDPKDPLENFNRGTSAFNYTVDKTVVKPIAQAYTTVVPAPARQGVHNVLNNPGDLWIGVNNTLQGKPQQTVSDIARFLINTTLGVGGLVDVASHLELKKHDEDFGQTLGKWGVPSGPYLVLPFIGSSSVRDSLDLIVRPDPLRKVGNEGEVWGARGLTALDVRAQLLGIDDLVEGASLDSYAFVRDAYLLKREADVRNGVDAPFTDPMDDPNYDPSQPAKPAQ